MTFWDAPQNRFCQCKLSADHFCPTQQLNSVSEHSSCLSIGFLHTEITCSRVLEAIAIKSEQRTPIQPEPPAFLTCRRFPKPIPRHPKFLPPVTFRPIYHTDRNALPNFNQQQTRGTLKSATPQQPKNIQKKQSTGILEENAPNWQSPETLNGHHLNTKR